MVTQPSSNYWYNKRGGSDASYNRNVQDYQDTEQNVVLQGHDLDLPQRSTILLSAILHLPISTRDVLLSFTSTEVKILDFDRVLFGYYY